MPTSTRNRLHFRKVQWCRPRNPILTRRSGMSEFVSETVPVGGALSGVEKLNSTHVLKAFKSGRHPLDLFIRRHALKNQEADSSQTYVVHRNGPRSEEHTSELQSLR